MQNFLRETKAVIAESNKTPADISFIGSRDHQFTCSWDEFSEIADVLYDAGYGTAYVASDLVIEFSDGSHLSRGEYDGSEWWEYNEVRYLTPDDVKPIKKLISETIFDAGTVANMNKKV